MRLLFRVAIVSRIGLNDPHISRNLKIIVVTKRKGWKMRGVVMPSNET